jgi:predicted DNA binding protein
MQVDDAPGYVPRPLELREPCTYFGASPAAMQDMITARIAVLYEDDWTAQTADYDAYGKFLTYSFVDNKYFTFLVLTSNDIESTIELVREHPTITEAFTIERSNPERAFGQSVTLAIKSSYREIPPMELLTYEGFFPIGYPSLFAGKIYFDLLLEDRAGLRQALDLLREFGDVSVKYLSEDLFYQTAPPLDEFETLIESISQRQLEVLALAVEWGYFEDTREVTLEALAAELDISKATVSAHLRKGWRKVMSFAHRYLTEPSRISQ